MDNNIFDHCDFVKGTSKKNGSDFYRLDFYFNIPGKNNQVRKSVFFTKLEVLVLDIEKHFK